MGRKKTNKNKLIANRKKKKDILIFYVLFSNCSVPTRNRRDTMLDWCQPHHHFR